MAQQPDPKVEVPVFEAGGETTGKSCSICQTVIIAGEKIVGCPHCSLPFHSECWNENGGCSVYGCKGTPKTVKAQDADPVSNAWAGEKPCPSCGKTIKGQAVRCRFCGASFASRDVISKEEYSRREYEGNEYSAVRNKIIGLFLLSAAGCLSPIAGIMAGILVTQKEFMGIDYNRLPSTLKAVLISSLAVSGLMLLLLAAFVIFD